MQAMCSVPSIQALHHSLLEWLRSQAGTEQPSRRTSSPTITAYVRYGMSLPQQRRKSCASIATPRQPPPPSRVHPWRAASTQANSGITRASSASAARSGDWGQRRRSIPAGLRHRRAPPRGSRRPATWMLIVAVVRGDAGRDHVRVLDGGPRRRRDLAIAILFFLFKIPLNIFRWPPNLDRD
ncbi:hypothetical protein GQ55_7G238700 [Panicum hallii var. hallii]|uniref:Uncharacterized protein n=1 Tax=Panicum hallii var. hallii TaxID=1504633 RepID=A0A2T7CYC2_9POAL|nr:hypothetical protein GQ55_7G238700 [Panicum hallii var. hallii]